MTRKDHETVYCPTCGKKAGFIPADAPEDVTIIDCQYCGYYNEYKGGTIL